MHVEHQQTGDIVDSTNSLLERRVVYSRKERERDGGGVVGGRGKGREGERGRASGK